MMDVADKENATSGRPTTSSDSEKAQIRQLAEELQLSRSALQEADLDRLVGDGDDALSPADSGFDSANSNLSLPRSVFEDTVEGSGSFDMDAYSVPGVGARPHAGTAPASSASSASLRAQLSAAQNRAELLEAELAAQRTAHTVALRLPRSPPSAAAG